MDSAYGVQGVPVAVQVTQHKPDFRPVSVQGVPATHYGTAGLQEWDDQSCWMTAYQICSIVGTVIVGLVLWPFGFGVIVGLVAACLYGCSRCSTCYAEDKRKGARIIQILAIVAASLDGILAVLLFAFATFCFASNEEDAESRASGNILGGVLIGAGLVATIHMWMSIITARKFSRVIKSFPLVCSPLVAL